MMDALDPTERDNERLSRRCAMFSDFLRELSENHRLVAKDNPAFSKVQYHSNRLADMCRQASDEYALLSATYQELVEHARREVAEARIREGT